MDFVWAADWHAQTANHFRGFWFLVLIEYPLSMAISYYLDTFAPFRSLCNISKITRLIRVFMLPWIYNFDIESIQSRPFLPSVKQGNSFQVISWHLQSSCSRYFFPKTIWQSNIGNAEDNMTVHFSLLLQAQHGARAASFYSAPA